MKSNIDPTVVLLTGKTAHPLGTGQAHRFKALAGEHYRIVVGKQGDEQTLLDDVIATRTGPDLQLRYADGTQLTLENYYVECRAGACGLTLPDSAADTCPVRTAPRVLPWPTVPAWSTRMAATTRS